MEIWVSFMLAFAPAWPCKCLEVFADISPSCRGRVVGDSKSKQPKVTCRNWESGVVIPVPIESKTAQIWHPGMIWNQINMQVASKEPLPVRARYELDVKRTTTSGSSANGAGAKDDSKTCLAKHDDTDLVGPAVRRSLSEVFAGVLPVPIQYPAQRHAAHQQQPWFFRN